MLDKIQSYWSLGSNPPQQPLSMQGTRTGSMLYAQERRPYHSSQLFVNQKQHDGLSPSSSETGRDKDTLVDTANTNNNNLSVKSNNSSSASSSRHQRRTSSQAAQKQRDAAPFLTAMAADPVDLAVLRQLSWHGCPDAVRADVWMLLTGHWHPHMSQRATLLTRKRQEYVSYVTSSYKNIDWDAACASSDLGTEMASTTALFTSFAAVDPGMSLSLSKAPPSALGVRAMAAPNETQIIKQIRKDIPRMTGGLAWLSHPRVQQSVERVLFVWSLRHPACGYVQGMNDFVAPFLGVLLAAQFFPRKSIAELECATAEELQTLWTEDAVDAEEWLTTIEADTYWASSYLLNVMQDNYTHKQRGITAMVQKLEAVVRAADATLHEHLVVTLEINYTLFTFRWMNCLLLRELTAPQGMRLLDAYLSDEEKQWATEHVYVCAALLLRWSGELMAMDDFGAALCFLQNPPTAEMLDVHFTDVLSEAYLLRCLFESSATATVSAGSS